MALDRQKKPYCDLPLNERKFETRMTAGILQQDQNKLNVKKNAI